MLLHSSKITNIIIGSGWRRGTVTIVRLIQIVVCRTCVVVVVIAVVLLIIGVITSTGRRGLCK